MSPNKNNRIGRLSSILAVDSLHWMQDILADGLCSLTDFYTCIQRWNLIKDTVKEQWIKWKHQRALKWEKARKQVLHCTLLQLIFLGFKVSKNQDMGTLLIQIRVIKQLRRLIEQIPCEGLSSIVTLTVGKKCLLSGQPTISLSVSRPN